MPQVGLQSQISSHGPDAMVTRPRYLSLNAHCASFERSYFRRATSSRLRTVTPPCVHPVASRMQASVQRSAGVARTPFVPNKSADLSHGQQQRRQRRARHANVRLSPNPRQGRVAAAAEEQGDVPPAEKAAGRATYRPSTYSELITDAANSVIAALGDGHPRMEVEFPAISGGDGEWRRRRAVHPP